MNTFSTRGLARLGRAGALLLSLGAGVACAQPVGQVLFVIGEARIAGTGQPIGKGTQLEAGQVVVTGANGHVHVRFVDEAFVSVRPGSQLRVDEYVYDPEAPQHNRVKFTLENGTSRLITGKAGQANKEGFRLNTPMAAIGVRGTDFVVQATPESTRVTVQQGAVVLSPFGEGCAADALGPCGGSLARQLSGSLGGAYLELRDAARAPVLVAPAEGGKNPNRLAPPRPEEPVVSGSPIADAVPTAQVGAPGSGGSSQIWWGRWGNAAQGEFTAGPGREVIARTDLFVLVRSTENLNIPDNGSAKFRIASSEAYKRTSAGYQGAAVTDGSLTVDFGKQKFATNLTFQEGGSTELIKAQGSLTETGRFKADPRRSNAIISGALSGDGNEAAYYFQKKLDRDTKALGIVRWER